MKRFITISVMIMSMIVGQFTGTLYADPNQNSTTQMVQGQNPATKQAALPEMVNEPKLMSPEEMNQLRGKFLALLNQKTESELRAQTKNSTKQEKILYLAYALYRKFSALYQADHKSEGISASSVVHSLVDYSIRAAALYTHLSSQYDKYMPIATILMLQSQMEGAGRSTNLLSGLINKVLVDTSEFCVNPDFYETKLPLPGKVLMQAAPAALYHAGKLGLGFDRSYEYTRVTDKTIATLTGQGYTLNGTIDGNSNELYVVEKPKTDALNQYGAYKKGIEKAVQSIIKEGAGVLETALTDKIDKNTLQTVEDRTLGVIKPKMISTLTKDILAPYILLKMTEAAKGTDMESLVPEYSKFELGMQGKQELLFTKDGQSSKVTVAGKELDPLEFARKKVIEYTLCSMGAYILINGVSYFVHNHEDNAYNLFEYLARIFVKTGICSKNPVEQLAEKIKEARCNYWLARPEFLTELLGAATVFAYQKESVFSDNDRKILPGLLQEMSDVFTEIDKAQTLKPDAKLHKELARNIDAKLARVIEAADSNNIISKLAKQFTKELVLTKDSAGRMFFGWIGSNLGIWTGKKLAGKKLGIA